MKAQTIPFSRVQEILDPLFGKSCCRSKVWKPRSLWIGFGEKLYHGNTKLIDTYYGEWEIGTYYSAWRVCDGDKILCGSTDSVECVDDLDRVLKSIDFGRIISLQQPTKFDVRAEFDSGVNVSFLATTSDNDHSFGILNGIEKLALRFSPARGWAVGPSNKGWGPLEK